MTKTRKRKNRVGGTRKSVPVSGNLIKDLSIFDGKSPKDYSTPGSIIYLEILNNTNNRENIAHALDIPIANDIPAKTRNANTVIINNTMKKFISDYNGSWRYYGKQQHEIDDELTFRIYQFYRNIKDGKKHMNKPGNSIYILDMRFGHETGPQRKKIQHIFFDEESLKDSLKKNERIRTHLPHGNPIDYIENDTYTFECILRGPVTEKLMALQTARQKRLPEDIQYMISNIL